MTKTGGLIADEEEHFVDMNLVLGSSISMGVPWDAFSEFEIQAILKIHFERLGFEVIWRHRDDPANEGGVDLECKNESTGKTVLVDVKKKPKKEAIGQVFELSQKPADQRVYVYVSGAAQSFRNNREKFRRRVDFWDENKLEEKLDESGLTLSLKVDNSPANQAMFMIMRNLWDAINTKPPKGPLPKSSQRFMQSLWGMKDRSVTVSKCAGMTQLMFEDPKRFGELSYKQVQNLVVWCFDYIYAKGLLSLQHTFEDLDPGMKKTIYGLHKRTRVRSNWHELLSYGSGFMPSKVEYALRDHEKAKEEMKKIDEIIKSMTSNRKVAETKRSKLDEGAEVSPLGFGFSLFGFFLFILSLRFAPVNK